MKRLIVLFATLICLREIGLVGDENDLLKDKTLVAWVSPASLTQRGGSVLTIDDLQEHFDGIVFGELEPARWMAGSDFHRRTERQQKNWPVETVSDSTLVQIAIVYRGNSVTLLRDGREYAQQTITAPQTFGPNSVVLIGPRHVGNRDCFHGQIADARVYDQALTVEQLRQLKPDQPGMIVPWAWWTFDDDHGRDRTGRFHHVRLSRGAKIEGGRLQLDGKTGGFYAAHSATSVDQIMQSRPPVGRLTPPADFALHYHLMHPGGASLPGDPNAAYFLDGTYHLHYILGHPWRNGHSFSFVHVTSPDMLHWTWQPTKLQPSFTGHGMFSGTGFLMKDGRPAVVYHGQASGRNQIALATDRNLTAWEKPFAIEVRNPDGSEAKISHWDPDCFLIGDTYYAISGGENPPLMKSHDLKKWTLVGDFLAHDLPDVAKGEDISCPNFFPIGNKWMLLCISHDLGCRYYLGDWDPQREKFVPQHHGRMNFRRESQSLFSREAWRVDFFAPESVRTADGRRVMWAWCATLDRTDGRMSDLTIQSLPRELSLTGEGALRIQPLRELESLRFDGRSTGPTELKQVVRTLLQDRGAAGAKIAELTSEAMEVRIVIPRPEAHRKLFGFTVFDDGKGNGLPIVFRPETSSLRVGTAEAPFSLAELSTDEDVVLRIFIDRHLVEVFVNDRQAMLADFPDYAGRTSLTAFTVGAPTTLKSIETWKLKPTNQGFLKAQTDRNWEPIRE